MPKTATEIRPATKEEGIVERREELERAGLLATLEGLLEIPMVVLSFVMLTLFIIELTVTLPPGWSRTFSLINWGIWVAFVIEFVVKLSLAENKLSFVTGNWLTSLAILLPVFRIFRAVRALKLARSLGALRVLTVTNRTIRQIGVVFARRRLQYLVAIVAAVLLLGAAGGYYMERGVEGANITTFRDALWWAGGTVTTVGTQLYPMSNEGRILAFLLMVFGITVFGYIAASFASLFIHMDDETEQEAQKARDTEGFAELVYQIERLQRQVEAMNEIIAESGRREREVTRGRA